MSITASKNMFLPLPCGPWKTKAVFIFTPGYWIG
jgi:hypothetical protein